MYGYYILGINYSSVKFNKNIVESNYLDFIILKFYSFKRKNIPSLLLCLDIFVNSNLTKVLNMHLEQLYLIVGIPNKSIKNI